MKSYTFLIIFLCGSALLLSGCKSRKPLTDFSIPSFFLEMNPRSQAAATRTVTLPMSGTVLRVTERPVIFTDDIAWIELVQVDLGLALRFNLTGQGARKLTRLSVQNQGYRLVLFVLDEPIGARIIDGVIDQGVLFTFAEVEDEDLPDLVAAMNEAIVEARKRQQRRW